MNLGGNIKGFDWARYGFLLHEKTSGSIIVSSVLKFFIDYSWEIAFVLGMIAFAYELIRVISGQKTAIYMVVLKLALTMCLISYYDPLCKSAINFADNITQIITDSTSADINNMYLKKAKEKKAEADHWYQRFYKEKKLTEEEEWEFEKSSKFNPFKLSLVNFNPLKFIASLLLIFCQIAIFLISKFRDIALAILLLIGRLCIVAFIWDKTAGITKGWFTSFINALLWTFWLSIIIHLQYAGVQRIYFDNSEPLIMMEDIAECIVYLVLYLQVFNFGKEMLSGSLGSSASSFGTAATGGLATSAIAKGAINQYKKQSLAPKFPSNFNPFSNGLSQMENIKPVKVNSDAHYFPAPPKRIGVGETPSLPEPPKAIESGGPVIDVEHEKIE